MFTACGTPREDREPKLLVAAAADLVKVLPEIGAEFKKRSGQAVVFSFGASGILAQQIGSGAPFDAFLSADRQYIERLASDGHLAPGSRTVYAKGRLVLWSARLPLKSLEDLLDPRIRRVALANPGYAPYGRAARQALEREGLWLSLQPKIVIAENIRHTLEMAESGNVEAALTALSLTNNAGGFSWTVPDRLHEPLIQEAAVIARSRHQTQAQAFVQFLAGPEARPILARYGFLFP